MMMSENHNGHRSVWQKVSTEEPFIWTQYVQSDLTTQNSSHRAVAREWHVKLDNSHVEEGGGVLTSCHLSGGGRKGGGNRSSQDYQDYRGKPDQSHMVSDRAFNYFVTGEDGIEPGTVPKDTYTIDTVGRKKKRQQEKVRHCFPLLPGRF